MLVIHSKEVRTAMMSILYKGTEAQVFNQETSNSKIERLLSNCSQHERIMLLGHGSDDGLFSRDDMFSDDNRVLVGRNHACYLSQHGANIVGIWPNAYKFARREGLHGLFSGMLITDQYEAEHYGIITLQHIIEEANEIMFGRLRDLLDNECPLHKIPKLLKAMDDKHSSITRFNYNNFYYV